jgi:FkbM family methyltransferase
MKLASKAIWNNSELVKFYFQSNLENVSLSINIYQQNYSISTSYIKVQAIPLKALMSVEDIGDISMLKLDIEGAEHEVIENLLNDGIFPEQILLEYDESL